MTVFFAKKTTKTFICLLQLEKVKKGTRHREVVSFCQLFVTVEGAKPEPYQLHTPLCKRGCDKTHIRGKREAVLTEGRFHSIFMEGLWL